MTLQTDDVPRLYRFVVRDAETDDELANVCQYVSSVELSTVRVFDAMAEAYPDRSLTVEAYPA